MAIKSGIKEGDSAYTSMLFVAGIALILSGISAIETGWSICWCGIGYVLVGIAYLRCSVCVFGKQLDGGRSWLNRIVLCPFLFLNYLTWHLRHRVFSKEDSCNEIAPGIWLGRRPLDGELPANVCKVVDLTAEFSASLKIRKLNYICIPTLDGLAPSDEEFRVLMDNLSSSCEPVYIHCAAGHGRSAMVAVALLVARGLATDLVESERIVKDKRPGISLKKTQRELLQRWFECSLKEDVQNRSRFLELMKQVFAGAGSLFLWIVGVLLAAIFAVGLPLRICSEYQKDSMGTIISWTVTLCLLCFAYWSNRKGD